MPNQVSSSVPTASIGDDYNNSNYDNDNYATVDDGNIGAIT